MATIIRWSGIAAGIVSAAGVALLLTNAQAQSRILVVPQTIESLSGPQKASLGTAVASIFPGVPAAAIDTFSCRRNQNSILTCVVRGDASGDAAAYFAAREARASVALVSWDDTTAAWLEERKKKGLTQQQKTDLGNTITTLWPTASLLTSVELLCRRDQDDNSIITCALAELQTKTQAEALTILRDVGGARDVGVAE